jgi:hypothetical protein
MLRVLGSTKRLCDRLTRREALRAGGLGMFSLSLADLLHSEAAAERKLPGFGQAKQVILLYLYGAAAQHETFDPKPDAPLEIRGEFASIQTAVPGLRFCEHLPRLAAIADRWTVVRSMTHPYNLHSVAYALTGDPGINIPREILRPLDLEHWPFFGSVIDYLDGRRGGSPPEMPRNLALPFQMSSHLPGVDRGGMYGGFLGRPYDPVWTEFEGTATRNADRWLGNRDKNVADPYLGVTPESRLLLATAALPPAEITLDRLDRRRGLLEQLEQARRDLDRVLEQGSFDRYQQMAFSLLATQNVQQALDVSRETAATRERYGMNLFGQSVLAGRRLLEAGARLVSVVWDEYETVNSAWDTHFDHYQRLKTELLPGLDQAASALVLDLEASGRLDETLVLCLTEHGRTPKITAAARGGGREHWSHAYSCAMAGAGVARGRVVGSSDRDGAYVKATPISPKDILATTYHLLGIDHHQTIHDRAGRPLPLVAEGNVRSELLA